MIETHFSKLVIIEYKLFCNTPMDIDRQWRHFIFDSIRALGQRFTDMLTRLTGHYYFYKLHVNIYIKTKNLDSGIRIDEFFYVGY